MKKKGSTEIPRDKRIRSEVAGIRMPDAEVDYSDVQGIQKDKSDNLLKKFEIIVKEEGRKSLTVRYLPHKSNAPEFRKEIKKSLANLHLKE